MKYEWIDKQAKTVRAVNPARRARRKLMRMYGITSGRQWVKLRKRLKRAAHAEA